MKKIFFLQTVLYVIKPSLAFKDHYDLTRAILERSHPALSEKRVQVESLDFFLKHIKKEDVITLFENTEYYMKEQTQYRPVPESLKLSLDEDLTKERFIEAMRYNPKLTWETYVRCTENHSHENCKTVQELEDYDGGLSYPTYSIKLNPNAEVSALSVLATAADEPDNGGDQNLFPRLENGFNDMYGFGPQPEPKSTNLMSSQAPFHIDFSQESWLIKTLGGFKTSYVKYRIYQYSELSKLAFQHERDYWGYRFLGRALHYIQDLCQPYHTTLVPGTTSVQLITSCCFPQKKTDLKHTAIKGHVFLEHFFWSFLPEILKSNEDIFSTLMHEKKEEPSKKTYDYRKIDEISSDSYRLNGLLARDIEKIFPEMQDKTEPVWEELDTKILEKDYFHPKILTESSIRLIVQNLVKHTSDFVHAFVRPSA